MSPTHAPEAPPRAAIHGSTFRVRWEPKPGGPYAMANVSRAQLHAEACLLCEAERPDLVDAGHMFTEEGGWRAKVCPEGMCGADR